MRLTLIIASLTWLASCNSGGSENGENGNKPKGPDNMSYSIVDTFPHDTSSYTQGLLIYKGDLYEGTGNWGFSKLMKVNLKTGKAEKEISLDKKYFGEGVTIVRDTVYQLTYKEKKVFVYTLPDFKKIKEYDVDFEGWGLTNDGTHLIVSTGSDELRFYDPSTFRLVKTQGITEAGSPVNNINELEYINGFIYANRYEYEYVLKIDPNTGVVVARANINALWERAKSINPKADVPNGIAYDSASKKIYITGKWWPELYQVTFGQ